jgi:hypothetical protein
MKIKNLAILTVIMFLISCASIPRETIILSQTLGHDLQALHESHRNCIDIYFRNIKGSINSFIDDVYAPYVIYSTLNKEMDSYKKGASSLYKSVEVANQKEGRKVTDDALKTMSDFLTDTREQIEKKRNEYLFPVLEQENELTFSIDQAYENAINANSKITGYLQSVRKVKESDKETMSKAVLPGADTISTNHLVRLSEWLDQAVEEGKKIDIRSEGASRQVETISKKIKDLTSQY